MAYGKLYTISFKNRFQNDTYRVEIWEKDFAGDVTELTGAETPVNLSSDAGDTDLLTPIKTTSLTFSFNTNSISIEDFYSDDDEQYRVDFYCESDSAGNSIEQLLFTGFLVQEDVSESVTDIKHVITLKATDNLALLKNVKFDEVAYFDDFPLLDQHFLGFIIQLILNKTNLYNLDQVIDQNLPLRIYDNLFETTTDNRADADTNDPMFETVLFTGMFQNSDGTWKDCYSILEDILKSFNACLFQAVGCWNIVRVPEYKQFAGAIPGTEYHFNGSTTDVTAVTLDPVLTIDRNGDIQPVNEDQIKTIQRPLQYVKNTFNYEQPALIKNSNLQLPTGAIPFETSTVGSLRYDHYDLPTYFPDWTQRGGVTSYLVVVTDTTTDIEVDRYLSIIGDDALVGGIQFNPIWVSKDDKIDLSFSVKALDGTSDSVRYWIRAILLVPGDQFYTLVREELIIDSIQYSGAKWYGPYSNDNWDNPADVTGALGGSIPAYMFFSFTNQDPDWSTIGLYNDKENGTKIPLIPVTGILLLQINGTNCSDSDRHDTGTKDIKVSITNYVNQSTSIKAQTHQTTGVTTLKAIEENDIPIDDSPRNSIAGTLFTDARTNFDATDVTTTEETNVGDIFFTPTRLWARGSVHESLRLGNIITQERILLKLKSRLEIEGMFKNVRVDTAFVSLLSVFNFGWLSGKVFAIASISIDYMACLFTAKLVEIYNTDDVLNDSVFVTGHKDEELSISTGNLQFDTITNYGGADSYITPSLTNSRFTYNGFDTTLDLSVIVYVPISGSGTATVTVLKNGVSIASDTVDATAMFKRFDFLLTGVAVTDNDYIEVNVDTGGADVDIQEASLNITVNNVMAVAQYPYIFNYIYQTS